jgi:hypothetical protein
LPLKIILPEGVHLKRVVANKGLLKVWMSAFEGCTSLTDLQLPETAERVNKKSILQNLPPIHS